MMAFPTARGFLLILMTVGTVGVALVNVGLATALAASIFCSLLAASFLLAQFSLYRIVKSVRSWRTRCRSVPGGAGANGLRAPII